MRAADIGPKPYAPNTPLEWTFEFPDAYSLIGKRIDFLLSDKEEGEPLFRRTNSGDDPSITVSGQVVSISVYPNAVNQIGEGAETFTEILQAGALLFAVEVGTDEVTEYRAQGSLAIKGRFGGLR